MRLERGGNQRSCKWSGREGQKRVEERKRARESYRVVVSNMHNSVWFQICIHAWPNYRISPGHQSVGALWNGGLLSTPFLSTCLDRRTNYSGNTLLHTLRSLKGISLSTRGKFHLNENHKIRNRNSTQNIERNWFPNINSPLSSQYKFITKHSPH